MSKKRDKKKEADAKQRMKIDRTFVQTRYILKIGFQKGERIKTQVEIGNNLLSLQNIEIHLAIT